MATDGTAYAALELEPGADRQAVEAASRRLIKRHHPDRSGGDAIRAAEINRAYAELRWRPQEPTQVNIGPAERSTRRRWWWAAVLAAAALFGGLYVRTPSAVRILPALHLDTVGKPVDPMTVPLALGAVDGAIRDAAALAGQGDEAALTAWSRDCHQRLRARPTITQLDRCAAFDDAVIQIQDRDPLRDAGPFNTLAVTARQMNAATAMSRDYLAIDSRLDAIRLRAELTLAPTLPPPVPLKTGAEPPY